MGKWGRQHLTVRITFLKETRVNRRITSGLIGVLFFGMTALAGLFHTHDHGHDHTGHHDDARSAHDCVACLWQHTAVADTPQVATVVVRGEFVEARVPDPIANVSARPDVALPNAQAPPVSFL
jgi:hypothetical protein